MKHAITVSAIGEGYRVEEVIMDAENNDIEVVHVFKAFGSIISADDYARKVARRLRLPLYMVLPE